MIGFENINWQIFKIGDIMQIENCKCQKVSILKDGDTPYVGATNNNNGVLKFVERKESLLTKGNCIVFICDGEGSIGLSVYKHEDFIGTTTVKVGRCPQLNRYNAMFITTVADTVRGKYNFGYKRNEKNLKRETIMLPATAEGTPDWQFMEAYMKQQEQAILKPTIERLCKQLITNELMGGGSKLSNLTWKEFIIEDLFHAKRPLARKEDEYSEGDVQFVASGCVNNGVTKFCAPKSDEVLDKGNCLTVSPVDGSCYYQATDFLGRGGAGSSIIILYAKNFELNRFNALFISQAITKTASAKYSYGHMASLDRIKRDKIILPANKDGQPDFAFMSSFMQQIEKDILGTTLRYFADKQQITPPHANDLITWQVFLIRDIFTISAGKRLTKADMQIGNRPFVGATDNFINNGITEWVNNANESIDQNLLGVNYNGSVGEVFYHPYECIFSDDVKRLHLKKQLDSKYILLFIKTAILQQKVKYAYGYKFNEQRMLKQPIMLPCTPEGTPDWQYMESYMRHIESQQIVKYLQHYTKYIAD